MSNRIKGGMVAPQSGNSGRSLKEGFELPDEGINQMICIGMVDLGTHSESYKKDEEPKDRRKICLVWELPSLKQITYEGDTVPRSYIKYDEMSYSLYNSGLLKAVTALANGKYSADQLQSVDLFEFIGTRAMLSLKHDVKNRSGKDVTYVNIESYSRMGKTPSDGARSDGNEYAFYIDQEGENFMTDNFAELPRFMREKIMKSKEGVAYAAQGGKFAEAKERQDDHEDGGQAPSAPKPNEASVPDGFEFKDLSNQGLSYQDYINAKWSDKNLFDAGYLIKVARAPQSSVPTPEQPKTPSAPQAPQQQAAVAPPKEEAGYNPFADDDDDDLPY